ncbi:hypothetical protein [Helicobacter marmotae]|uniref:hypothetical protein n=1 Tax=Helicobacter marmotae TaxID=152490 RepID=UPI0011C02F9A|nr:hypothetical protein [Helicobacter marmotae]
MQSLRHDNKSQMSFSSEIYSHHRIKLNRTKCHLLKRRRGGGYIRGQEYYYGVGACLHERSSCPHYFIKLCTFKPLPLIEKEKRESLTTPLVCHSEGARNGGEESLLSARELLSKTPKSTTSDSCRDSPPPKSLDK